MERIISGIIRNCTPLVRHVKYSDSRRTTGTPGQIHSHPSTGARKSLGCSRRLIPLTVTAITVAGHTWATACGPVGAPRVPSHCPTQLTSCGRAHILEGSLALQPPPQHSGTPLYHQVIKVAARNRSVGATPSA